MSSTSPPRSAYAAFVAVCLIWGTTYLGIRIALETIPPMLMGALRWLVAGGLILPTLAAAGHRMPRPHDWPGLAVLGLLLIGFGNGGVVWAEQTVPSGLTALLVASIPFWMIGVGRVLGDSEPLTRRRTLGLLVGFGGVVVLVWPELTVGGGRDVLIGVGATQLACLGWAIGSVLARRRASTENVLVTASAQMIFGGIVMLIAGLVLGEQAHLAFNVRTGAALVYLAVVGSVGGFLAYAYALKHLPVANVSLYAYVNPVIAVALGTAVLGEPLSPRLAISGAAVLMGMALVRS